jgi:CubicO group peptidase (beta-lactamase class C family)
LGGFGLALLMATAARADGLPHARPEDLGFSSARLDYIDRFYADKVQNGEMAGIVTLIARHGKIAHFTAVGYADTATHKPMRTDSIFRIYSMTKPITATALMMLYEQGEFQR